MSNNGPLAGMRVLELAQIMAGPTCGMMLADMGADVIKVEKLPGGDDTRDYREPRVNGESAPFLILNRNKRSIGLNLKLPQGQEVLRRLPDLHVDDGDLNHTSPTFSTLTGHFESSGNLLAVDAQFRF